MDMARVLQISFCIVGAGGALALILALGSNPERRRETPAGMIPVSQEVLARASSMREGADQALNAKLIDPRNFLPVPIQSVDCYFQKVWTESGSVIDMDRSKITLGGTMVPVSLESFSIPGEVANLYGGGKVDLALFTRVAMRQGQWALPPVTVANEGKLVTPSGLSNNPIDVAANSVATCASLAWAASMAYRTSGTKQALENLVGGSSAPAPGFEGVYAKP